MKIVRNLFAASACLVIALTLQACVSGARLLAKPADPAEVQWTYTLLLYGCRYPDDLENMAILVQENGPYPVEIYAPDFMYKVKKGLPAPQALAEAEAFIQCSFHKFWMSVLRKIPDEAGRTIGYEVKPLYVPWEVGVPEVLLSSYSLKDGKVTAYILLDPLVEKRRDTSDGQRDDSSGM